MLISPEDGKSLKSLVLRLTTILGGIDEKLNKIDGVNETLTALKDGVLLETVNTTKQVAESALEKTLENTAAITTLQEKMAKMKYNYNNINQENIKLKSQVNYLDNYGRRNNLVVRGIAETNEEDCVKLLRSFLKNNLNMDDNFTNSVKFVRCHRLGKKQATQSWGRPIIVRFVYFTDRELVWKQRHCLSKSSFSLNENFAADTEFNRNRLYPIYRDAKNKPQYQKKIVMVKDKLIIDSNTYDVDTIDKLPDIIHPKQYTRKSDDSTIVFGGVLSEFECLSNWSASPINYENKDFSSAEQAYMYAKATANGAHVAAQHIMFSDEPRRIKEIGSTIVVNDQWERTKKNVMLNILRAKFNQNENLKKILQDSQGKTLGEAGRDTFWAIGLPLTNRNVLNKGSWNGKSELGNILEAVRSEL